MSDEFQDLIRQLDAAFTEDEVDKHRLMSRLNEYRSNRGHWSRYYHELESNYSRNLVHTVAGKYDLILMVWRPGQSCGIHDHPGSCGIMKILQGKLLDETFVEQVGAGPLKTGESVLERDSCTMFMEEHLVLHRVSNSPESAEIAVSLHLHAPPFDWCLCYDPETGARDEVVLKLHSLDGQLYFERNGVAK